jgi:hypothetical protein
MYDGVGRSLVELDETGEQHGLVVGEDGVIVGPAHRCIDAVINGCCRH